jgi:hypothetical protein
MSFKPIGWDLGANSRGSSSKNDLRRNAVVSVFLRTLEYYSVSTYTVFPINEASNRLGYLILDDEPSRQH